MSSLQDMSNFLFISMTTGPGLMVKARAYGQGLGSGLMVKV